MTTTEAVYAAICRLYEASEQLPVTVREVQVAAGLSSSSVADYHVKKLQIAGRIRRNEGIARSIRPAGERRAA